MTGRDVLSFVLHSVWVIGCVVAAIGLWVGFERLQFHRGLRRLDRDGIRGSRR